jgi:hypothetical protein
MTFERARKKLLAMANGEYCSISFTEIMSEYDGPKSDCSLYIHGKEHSKGETWEEAIAGMERQLSPMTEGEVSEMAPKMEVA